VQASEYATLVGDANRVLCCIVNRAHTDVPVDSVDVRTAFNLAVDRDRIIADGVLGYANPLPAMTPPWCSGFPEGAQPYPHDPEEATRLFDAGGWPHGRPVRLAAPAPLLGIAQLIASDLRRALDVAVEVSAVPDGLAGPRMLVEKNAVSTART
jgi:peptide/nickel transport system substrate-binding protein